MVLSVATALIRPLQSARTVSAGYEFFEHTADVGIRAWGGSLEEAFAQAAVGLVANMVDVSQAKVTGAQQLDVEAESDERLLYRFLEEVLYLFETRLWVVTRAHVAFPAPGRLHAELEGEDYDAARHGHVHEIKAITYHDLRVQSDPPRVEVIVDI